MAEYGFREGITAYIGADTSGFRTGMGRMRGMLASSRQQFNRWAKIAGAALVGV